MWNKNGFEAPCGLPKIEPFPAGSPGKIWVRLGPKPGLDCPQKALSEVEGQQIQRDFGGGVWESNPPPASRRDGSPALKAGKVTGPISPPQLQYSQNTILSECTQLPPSWKSPPVRLWCQLRWGNGLVQVGDREMCAPSGHRQRLVTELFGNVPEQSA